MPPSVDLDSGTAGINYAGAFTEGGLASIGNNIQVTQGTLPITSAVINIDDAFTGDRVFFSGAGPSIIVDTANSTDTHLVLIGTGNNIDWQSALSLVRFENTTDNPSNYGSDTERSISVAVSDGSASSTTAYATIAINAVDDPPVVDLNGSDGGGTAFATSYTEDNSAGVAIGDADLTIIDDQENVVSVTVRIVNGIAGDVLFADTPLPFIGFAGNWNAATFTFTLTATSAALASEFATALTHIRFRHDGNNPDANGTLPTRTVIVNANDGTQDSTTAVSTITITAVIDPPTIDLDGPGGTNDYATSYTEDGTGVPITDTDVDIVSTEGGITEVTVTITDFVAGDELFLNDANPNVHEDISFNFLTPGVVHITGGGTAQASDFETALRYVSFRHPGEVTDGSRTLTFVVTDFGGTSNTATTTITLNAVNDPAVIGGSDTGSVTEDGTTQAIGALTSNDPDNNSGFQGADLIGTYGAFEIQTDGSWTYNLNNGAPNVQALSTGQQVTDTFTVHSTDGTAHDVVITINGVDEPGNSTPVITGGPATGDATEAPSLDGIRGADQTPNFRLEPVVNYDAAIVSLLAAHPNDMHAVLLGLQAQLPSGSGFAEAMAIVWDYVDDNFSYYNTIINEISARLSVEYALYLTNGGAALTGTAAKYTPDGADPGTAPDRYQSLHDNILGNLNGAGLVDKFLDSSGGGSNGPPNGTADQAAYDRIIQLLADNMLSDLFNRPVYSGTEGAANLALAYDQANGLLPATGGTLTATDGDGDTLTWSGSATGTYGTFTIASNGAWTYLLDQFDPDTQALGAGESALDTFTATVDDGNGGTASQQVTITVHGSNDAPVGVADALLAGRHRGRGLSRHHRAIAQRVQRPGRRYVAGARPDRQPWQRRRRTRRVCDHALAQLPWPGHAHLSGGRRQWRQHQRDAELRGGERCRRARDHRRPGDRRRHGGAEPRRHPRRRPDAQLPAGARRQLRRGFGVAARRPSERHARGAARPAGAAALRLRLRRGDGDRVGLCRRQFQLLQHNHQRDLGAAERRICALPHQWRRGADRHRGQIHARRRRSRHRARPLPVAARQHPRQSQRRRAGRQVPRQLGRRQQRPAQRHRRSGRL